jgi:ABC-type transport system involved in multi-copper enzyme maturation permease subunit
VILLIARRELLGHLRSVRMRALFALVVSLLGTGAVVNARRFEERVRYADALEALRVLTVALDRGDPDGLASRYGWRSGAVAADPAMRAIRPPSPTSVLAVGADYAAPGYWQFSTEGVATGTAFDVGDATRADRATLDLEFVVRAVLSLVALLLVADTIAGDRERGILRTLFAAPVSRIDVLLGKYAGGLLTLCVPLCAGALAAVVATSLAHAPMLGAGFGARLSLVVLGSVVFLATMLALGAAISAHCRDAQSAVVASVALWTVLVIVLPGAATLVAAVARPTLPEELCRQSQSEGLRQLEGERARALASVWRRVAGTDEVPLDSMVGPSLRRAYDAARAPVEADLMRRKRALIRSSTEERRRRQAAQTRLASALEALSPAAAFAHLAAAAAGTGPAARERWTRAVDEQQQRLESAVFDRVHGTDLFAARENYLRISYLPDALDPADRVPRYDELPAFSPPDGDLAMDVRDALPWLVALVLEAAVCLAVAARAILRMEI